MKIHYRIKNNAIEIVRCYGTDDRIVLPEEINGLPVVSAADSQALIQLQKEYCDKRKCLYCRFGYEYLKKTDHDKNR